MAIQVEILNQKSVTKTSSKGKPYTQLEVAYKNLSFQGKVEGKNIMSFGATESAFKTLATAQGGEVYDIEVVKNTAGYNDWVSAKKSDGSVGSGAASSPRFATTAPTSAAGSASPRSTYETPEERAKKQVYIVRQSSLSTAVDTLSIGAKQPPKVDEVIEIAKQFESYVFGDQAKVDSGLPHDITDDIPE